MMFMYTTTSSITEALYLVTYVQLFKMTVKVKAVACKVIAQCYKVGLYIYIYIYIYMYMTHFNSKASSTTDNDYSCHIKAV